MVENNTEATIIDADAQDVTEASEQKTPMNLSLIVAVLALVVSAIALIFVIRDVDNAGFSATEGSFDSIEARLQAIEAAPANDGDELSSIERELASVKSNIASVKADLAATVSALNAELDRVSASVSTPSAVETASAALAPSALSTVGNEALDAVNSQVAGLAETMDGSLARISELSAGLANSESVVAALTDRMQMAEGTLEALPNQITEQFTTALDDVKQNSASQIAGLTT